MKSNETKSKNNPFVCPEDGEKLTILFGQSQEPGKHFKTELGCPKCGFKKTVTAII
jgi:predicted RNA-binding Zn-ribbon protein involved in translation (DUF1610 family)